MKRLLALAAALLVSGSAPAQDLYKNADAQRVAAYRGALGEIEQARAGWEKVADLRDRMEKGKRKPIEERIQSKDQALFDQRALLATAPPERRRQIEDKILQLQNERDALVRELHQWTIAPERVPATYSALQGTILLRLDRPQEAIPKYDEALETDPGSSEAANNLASIYHLSGKNEKAMEIVQAAKKRGAKLHPDLEKSIEAALAAKK